MGSPETEPGRDSYREGQHQVKLSKGFWFMETEVSQKQWNAVMGNNPSEIQDDGLPVTNVSWHDCRDFFWKCSSMGLPVTFPTEEQWEYACRAGTTGEYSGNLYEMAWYASNSDSKTHPVGTKKPNAWGLYDMHGNVCEWCADMFSGGRNVRGGGAANDAPQCRSANCFWNYPDSKEPFLGFRCVLGEVK